MSEGAIICDERAAELKAAEENYEVLRPAANELLIDIDNKEAQEQFDRVYPIVDRYYGIVNIQSWKSKSGNKHIKVILRESVPISWKLVLQAALGSDPIKEVISLKRFEMNCPVPSTLFKPKDAEIVDEIWERGI